jgi:1,4-dihydroxy-2-naphthoate octaprenyltransferase
MREMSFWARWRYASKPESWPKLLVPMALGQSLGYDAAQGWSWGAAALGLAFTVLDGLFIVWLNDWGDRHVDTIKRQMFPQGCSPKTIPDGILPAEALLWGGVGVGLLALGVGALAALVTGNVALLPGAAVCLGIFVAYTLPPLRLNYRGGGEWLEMLGVGVALPWWQASLQSGRLWGPSWVLLAGFALLSLSSAVASGLSDEESDRAGGKATLVTMYGNWRARLGVELLLWIGPLAWGVAALCWPAAVPWWAALCACAPALWYAREAQRRSGAAVTGAFVAQRRYKSSVHLAIWVSGAVMALLLALRRWLGGA